MFMFPACSVFYIAKRHDILIHLCMLVYVCERGARFCFLALGHIEVNVYLSLLRAMIQHMIHT